MNDKVEMTYHADFAADCRLCWKSTRSSLFIAGATRPRTYTATQIYICDDCLLKLFKAVPLLSWAMRETILQEAVADLASAG